MSQTIDPAALALALASQPVPDEARERPALFVEVCELVPDAIVDLRYHGSDNFVGTRIDGYGAPRALLTRPAAEALAGIADLARREGLLLRLFDCYRPARAVAHFARWAADLDDTRTKPAYYPDYSKAELFAQGYIASRSGHSRGSTLDLTLARAESGEDLDMGTLFDLFSPRSWPASDQVSREQKANRELLRALMAEGGFAPFEMEWWHFTLTGEPFPDTYFDFPLD